MAFDPEQLIKMGDVRDVIRDELAGKITTVELIHILLELKKHAFPPKQETKHERCIRAQNDATPRRATAANR